MATMHAESWPGPNFWAFGSSCHEAGAAVPFDFLGAGAPHPRGLVPESKVRPSLCPSASSSKPHHRSDLSSLASTGRAATSCRRVVSLPQLPVLHHPSKIQHSAAISVASRSTALVSTPPPRCFSPPPPPPPRARV
ncbi:hypothetical protein PVAP13_8NG225502 [Panicum virgatum]|uniref:Uncharacterized protein n=1 Tax=Panicum virgatum TaxID=38727 RepID=A0A8T0PCG5_PANVG|nr:hypothetical protein PVAP13_8NG225502 [Panicum virgatum]